jgi:hypothetical protein
MVRLVMAHEQFHRSTQVEMLPARVRRLAASMSYQQQALSRRPSAVDHNAHKLP